MPARNQSRGAQRRRAAAQARRRQAQRRRAFLTAAAAIVLAAIVVAVIASRGGDGEPDITGLQRFDDLSRNHVTGTVTYAQTPPAGGDHNRLWQNCGSYAAPVANEAAVHSLEHGAVWITFRPDLADAEVTRLRALARGSKTLVSPFDGLPAPVVASAWGRQLRLQSANDPRLERFLDAFADGPQAPERGGLCSGGVGTPEE
jgi:hypothetical protein